MVHEVRIEYVTNKEYSRYDRGCKLNEILQ